MGKILKVSKNGLLKSLSPDMEFVLSKDGKTYDYQKEVKNTADCPDGMEAWEVYSNKISLSKEFCEKLVKEGSLIEVKEENKSQECCSCKIYQEIDKLLKEYNKELKNVLDNKDEVPECLRVEKMTVLKNLIKVLNYLKDLKNK